jgi:hypothetical protein
MVLGEVMNARGRWLQVVLILPVDGFASRGLCC